MTKRQFVTLAFEEIGYSYVYDLQPEQLQSAMKRLDAMMATWNGNGVKLNYPIPANPDDSDLDEETGVPDFSNEAIFLNLALRLAPLYGKVSNPDMKQSANIAYNVMLNRMVRPKERKMQGVPMGSGNKSGGKFIHETDEIKSSPTNEAEFLND